MRPIEDAVRKAPGGARGKEELGAAEKVAMCKYMRKAEGAIRDERMRWAHLVRKYVGLRNSW